MEKVVIDASVLVKFFSLDERDKAIETILNQIKEKKLSLALPDISIYELVNSLKLSKDFNSEEIYAAVLTLLEIKPQIVKFSLPLLKRILLIIKRYPLTVYDALYIASAEIGKIPLLTADYKHHQKRISKLVVYLDEWKG